MRRALVLGLGIAGGGLLIGLRLSPPAGGATPEPAPPSPRVEAAVAQPAEPPAPREEPVPDAGVPALRFVPVSGEEPTRVAPALGQSKRYPFSCTSRS